MRSKYNAQRHYIKMLNASHSIYLKVHGLYHEQVADSFFNMASMYQQQGNFEAALQMYEMNRDIEIEIRGEGHENEAGLCENMAAMYCEQGKWEEGMELFNKALGIYRKVHGTDHPVYFKPLTQQP